MINETTPNTEELGLKPEQTSSSIFQSLIPKIKSYFMRPFGIKPESELGAGEEIILSQPLTMENAPGYLQELSKEELQKLIQKIKEILDMEGGLIAHMINSLIAGIASGTAFASGMPGVPDIDLGSFQEGAGGLENVISTNPDKLLNYLTGVVVILIFLGTGIVIREIQRKLGDPENNNFERNNYTNKGSRGRNAD